MAGQGAVASGTTVTLECPACGNRYIAPQGADGWCVGPESRRHKPKAFKITKEVT